MDQFMNLAEDISLFCRMNMNTKKDLPIRSSEMGMLIYLVKTDYEKNPLSIAHFFKVSKAMITTMITSLQKQGYIEKQKSNKDKRSYIVIPTDKAIQLVEGTYTEYYKNMILLQEKMGKEDFYAFAVLIQKANQILLEDRENG